MHHVKIVKTTISLASVANSMHSLQGFEVTLEHNILIFYWPTVCFNIKVNVILSCYTNVLDLSALLESKQ